MASDKNLEEKIKDYQEAAKANQGVDLAALMINALKTENQNLVPDRQKHWAYLISIGLPPLGLLFAIRYFLSDKDDAKNVAWICVALTAVSVLLFVVLLKVFVSSSGTSLQQIEQINVIDIHQLSQ